MSQGSLQSRVDALRWYHTIDLGNGVVTPGVDNTALRLKQAALPDSFKGLSVLDIGAWDGFWSFEAERRGASRVVAADWYAWHGQGWGTDKGKAGFDLAREVLGSRVEDVAIDVMDLSPERLGTFDIVFFLGVLYHLPHPLLGLEKVASVSKALVVLETVVDMVGYPRPAMAFYPGTELNNDPTNWCGPNIPAVHGMLKAVGFTSVSTITPQRSAAYRAARAFSHVILGKNAFGPAFRQDRAVFHARKQI